MASPFVCGTGRAPSEEDTGYDEDHSQGVSSMEPTRSGTSQGRTSLSRIVGGVVLAGALVGGGAAGYLVLRDDGNDSAAVSTGDTTADPVLSAEAGMAARAQRAQFAPGGGAGIAESATAKVAAGSDAAALCGPADGEDYQPSAEELATANADTEGQAAAFDTFGIAYTRATDTYGYLFLQWDTDDVVAQSVSDSYWADRYPAPVPTQAELDKVKADNDVIARHLDAAGIAYTRAADDSGWETIDYDYDDPAAQNAVDAAYGELYPPVPPTAEEKATAQAENDKLAAAFDEAGIAYTRQSDELGWEWIEWDYEDPAVQAEVDGVFAELYPVEEGPVCLAAEGTEAAGDRAAEIPADGATAVAPADGSGDGSLGGDDLGDFAEPTPEQVARRDAEAAALVEGMAEAGVRHELIGESPWQTVQFDITNEAAVPVVSGILAARPAA